MTKEQQICEVFSIMELREIPLTRACCVVGVNASTFSGWIRQSKHGADQSIYRRYVALNGKICDMCCKRFQVDRSRRNPKTVSRWEWDGSTKIEMYFCSRECATAWDMEDD